MLKTLVRRVVAFFRGAQAEDMEKLWDAIDEGRREIDRQLEQHRRWQRNYEAGRYWGDDGPDEKVRDTSVN